MPKESKLFDFERDRIIELHKQGLSQRAIASEVHRSKTVIYNFLKDTESYGTAKSSGRPPAFWLFLKTEDDLPGKLRHSQC